ncbi:hypothetical protein Aduo_013447 [Ancylostoma duodenale]
MALFSYIDEENHLRGPFEGVQMHYWYLQGYLQPSLRIFVHQGLFGRPTSLEELIKKNGTSNPFYDAAESTKIEDNPCPNPTSSSPNSLYPFLTGNSSEELDGDNLSVAAVEACSARLQLVKSKYSIKHMNGVLEKFGATEKSQCLLCGRSYYGILMLEHCLGKEHIQKVYKNDRFFSERDKDKLLDMLDSVERSATAKDVFSKSGTKVKEEKRLQPEVVIGKDAKTTATASTSSSTSEVASEMTVETAATISRNPPLEEIVEKLREEDIIATALPPANYGSPTEPPSVSSNSVQPREKRFKSLTECLPSPKSKPQPLTNHGLVAQGVCIDGQLGSQYNLYRRASCDESIFRSNIIGEKRQSKCCIM